MNKIRINLYDLLLCFSNAQDLLSSSLSNHHQQVAYLAFRLAEQIRLPLDKQKDIFLAGLVHDIGALSLHEKLEIIEEETVNSNCHAFRGAKLLEGFAPMQNSIGIIKFHHIPWDRGNGKQYKDEPVPFESHVLHLADRVCALLQPNVNILSQISGVLDEISNFIDIKYAPELVDALYAISGKEFIWLDLVARYPISRIPDIGAFNTLVLEIDDIIDLSFVFSQIIDFRSSFTSRHSAGVAHTAERLAFLAGFSAIQCKMMLIAGYLHDLGKIAINTEILEKPSKLTPDEINEMRAHTYFTYHLLEPITQLKTINSWASFHHEKLNGKGYPFHIDDYNLSLGARIMAVADVFTAITEDRPYRKGMGEEHAIKVMKNMVESNSLDGYIVEILLNNFKEVNALRVSSQEDAVKRYEEYMRIGESDDAVAII